MAATYVPEIAQDPTDGILYQAGMYRSSIMRGKDVEKSARGFTTVANAERAKEIWDGRKWSGSPASSAAFFRQCFVDQKNRGLIKTNFKASMNNCLYNGFYGGWIENRTRGVARGTLYHYDLKSAYLWAGLQGLPTTVRNYAPGDTRYVVLARIRDSRDELPVTIYREPVVTLCHEDVEHYGLDIDVLHGYSWDQSDEADIVGQTFAGLADLDEDLLKKCTQSYWGTWAARSPVLARKFERGKLVKEWEIKNRHQNILWAQLIISRVTRRVHEFARNQFHLVYVDSILTDQQLPTGNNIGDWKHIETFPRGAYIKAPGVWARMPDEAKRSVRMWYKHAGYAEIY